MEEWFHHKTIKKKKYSLFGFVLPYPFENKMNRMTTSEQKTRDEMIWSTMRMINDDDDQRAVFDGNHQTITSSSSSSSRSREKFDQIFG